MNPIIQTHNWGAFSAPSFSRCALARVPASPFYAILDLLREREDSAVKFVRVALRGWLPEPLDIPARPAAAAEPGFSKIKTAAIRPFMRFGNPSRTSLTSCAEESKG